MDELEMVLTQAAAGMRTAVERAAGDGSRPIEVAVVVEGAAGLLVLYFTARDVDAPPPEEGRAAEMLRKAALEVVRSRGELSSRDFGAGATS